MKIAVTGANRGLGLELVRFFLSQGHQTFALARNESLALKELAEEYQTGFHYFKMDVTDEAEIWNAAINIEKALGELDLLVNNAAVFPEFPGKDIEELDLSTYLPTFDVNSLGPLRVVKHFLTLLRKGKEKRIVNISSEAGSIAKSWRDCDYSYCMSKAALNMATTILLNRLGKEGFCFRLIHPGWFSSEMGGSGAPITPMQSAQKVGAIAVGVWNENDPLFMDLDRKRWDW
ncbi:MAG: SDR family oxidoreductase [Spirochaetales bacterium]|nr:SDR family oxidoreductase [Spirochaetales bacterium]